MIPSSTNKVRLIGCILLLCAFSLHAAEDKKKTQSAPPPPPPPAKPASQSAPARQQAPAQSQRPAGYNTTNGPTVTHSGPTTNTSPTTTHTGPTANGPSTSRPTAGGGITTTNHLTTGGGITTTNRPTTGGTVTTGHPTTGTSVPGARQTATPQPAAGGAGGRGIGSQSNPQGRNVTFDTGAGSPRSNQVARPVAMQPHPTAPHQQGVTGRISPTNNHVVRLAGGNGLERRPNGGLSNIHDAKRGMDIHHNLGGGRQVMVERGDHSRVFAERGRPGFIQRPYSFHGHDFAARSYYYHGHEYQRYYRGAYFHGVAINVYAPSRYYSPGFYGWAYHPWGAPIVFAWGWGASPWVGYYGGYFTPYPVYATPSLWLTDYMISSDLAAAYAAGQESGNLAQTQPDPDSSPALTPEVKQQIADEVQRQLALENAEAQQTAKGVDVDPASSGIERLLSDGQQHIFVVGSSIDVLDDSSNECSLSDGDVLGLTSSPAPDAKAVSLVVLSSKGHRECTKSTYVTVEVEALQEMQNHMRETIDRGLAELQAKQGKSGLPAAPPSAQAPPTNAAFADIAPPPDPNGASDVNQQLKAADQSEQEVTKLATANN